MNRKLHNSLNAAMACSLLLAAVLLASAPLESEPLLTAATPAVQPAAAPQPSAHSGHKASRRAYQSVRMPFFSFFAPKD